MHMYMRPKRQSIAICYWNIRVVRWNAEVFPFRHMPSQPVRGQQHAIVGVLVIYPNGTTTAYPNWNRLICISWTLQSQRQSVPPTSSCGSQVTEDLRVRMHLKVWTETTNKDDVPSGCCTDQDAWGESSRPDDLQPTTQKSGKETLGRTRRRLQEERDR